MELLQRTMKNLKDNFQKCIDKRMQKTRSGAPASSLHQCKYFEQMTSLREKTANKPTESNIAPAIFSHVEVEIHYESRNETGEKLHCTVK